MGKKKKAKNRAPSEKWTKYKLEGKKVVRSEHCPKCGPGKFMAIHKDRKTCGSCHYTEFTKK